MEMCLENPSSYISVDLAEASTNFSTEYSEQRTKLIFDESDYCNIPHFPYPVPVAIPISLKAHIGSKEEATAYLVANEHILNGYRINYTTWKATLMSLFQMHNETINVWTHFIGFIACLIAFCIMSFARVIDDET